MHRGADAAVASVILPETIRREAAGYRLHPVLGDAMLQSMAGAVPLEADNSFSPYTYMPVGIRRVTIVSKIEDFTQPLYVYALRTSEPAHPSPERVEGMVRLIDGAGKVLVEFEGVQLQRIGRSMLGGDTSNDTTRWLYRTEWRELPLEGDTSGETAVADGEARTALASNGAWLIFADSRGVAQQLTERLAARGEASVLVRPAAAFRISSSETGNSKPASAASMTLDPQNEDHYRELFEQVFGSDDRACLGVVHLWSLDIREEPSSGPALEGRGTSSARRLGCGSAVQLVRAVTRASFPRAPRIWFVTAGAQAVGNADFTPANNIAIEQSPLLGLGRVAAIELPDLKPTLVDLDPALVSRDSDLAAADLARNYERFDGRPGRLS